MKACLMGRYALSQQGGKGSDRGEFAYACARLHTGRQHKKVCSS